MREYREENCETKVLQAVHCNMCGRKIKTEQGIVKEGCAHLTIPFEYFSDKDGERHHIDLCESCYDTWISRFQIPVTIEEMNELL